MNIEPLITEEAIANRVAELAEQISFTYQDRAPLLFVCVLKGAFVFAADLIRRMRIPVEVEFISVSSYEGTSSTGHVRLIQDLSRDIAGMHVVLLEDIIDSGVTVDYLLRSFSVRKPASLEVCTLLSKPEQHRMKHTLAWVGFEIADRFVVGYGLDYNGLFRNVPFIGELHLPSPSPQF